MVRYNHYVLILNPRVPPEESMELMLAFPQQEEALRFARGFVARLTPAHPPREVWVEGPGYSALVARWPE